MIIKIINQALIDSEFKSVKLDLTVEVKYLKFCFFF